MLSTKKEVYQFQVACISYLNLRQNKEFKEKIDKCLSQQFDKKKSASMRKTLEQDSTNFITLMMFYENSKTLII